MTKKLTDSEYQVQRNSVNFEWIGHPMNDSDVGYPDQYDNILSPLEKNRNNEKESYKSRIKKGK